MSEMEKQYNPQEIEHRLYAEWEKSNYFAPRDTSTSSVSAQVKPFSIVIPPPNVTGALHMGHALDNTLQDLLVRWHRMLGDSTLWVPGTDHAGIATQNVVEKMLAKEGKSRHDLGREEFLKKFGNGKSSMVHALPSSYACSVVPATGTMNVSRWTKAAPRLYVKFLWSFISRALFLKVNVS